ncbi:MAG TPA: hypothetical protein PKL70_17480, partial [Saprospiraceae bacterium]|nr:hypothetical protein [Saprospiraceae bacterium]
MKSKISKVVSAFIITLVVASAMTVYRTGWHWPGQVDRTKGTLSVTGNNASGAFGFEHQIKTVSTEVFAFLLQPVITCPAPDTVDCDSPLDTTALGSPIVVPDVACTMGIDTLFYSDSLADFDCPNTYNLFRTWIVVDSCGLSDTCIQSIRVQDTTRPTIVCPDDITIY